MKKVWALISSNKIIDFVDIEDLRDGEAKLERYTNLFSSSFFTKEITDDLTIKLGSTWNGSTFENTEGERKSNIANHYFALVSNNIVQGLVAVYTSPRASLYRDAEINGISAVDVTDMSFADLKVGMTWDGTSFTE